MSDSPSIVNAVNESIRTAQLQPRDRGTVALAKRYAALMQEPSTPAAYVEALVYLRRIVETTEDDQARRHLQRIEAALSEHTVTSDLGPKLLAALTALGCNPGSRAVAKGGAPGAGVPAQGGPAAALADLRRRRGERGGPR